MAYRCRSGKKTFISQSIAEDVLIELWSQNEYAQGQGPIAVYQCDECGHYHLTSTGTMNQRLLQEIKSGNLKRLKEANRWLEKFNKH